MALVDYNSSGDENSEAEEAKTETKTNLPPRKKLKPTKARIIIDLPPPTTSNQPELNQNTQPSSIQPQEVHKGDDLLSKLKRKKPASSKSSGLASLLPPPKRTQPQPQPQPSSSSSSSSSLSFKPKALEKPKHEPTTTAQDQAPSAVQSEPIQPTSSTTGTLNLFGLPPTSSSDSSASTKRVPVETLEPQIPLTVSSAPQVAAEVPPPPSLMDPYPGYWQRKDGSWCERDPSDPLWKAFYLQHYSQPTLETTTTTGSSSSSSDKHSKLPKDFFKDAPNSLVQFDAKQVAQTAWENKPKIIDPREEARQEQQASAATKPSKHISSMARGRHQLSSLLTDAQANRAELEDRISRGKFNRKAGGAKYGF
ncbi:kinase subunit of RNA polymerase II carboxy-terminal domain kinase I [Puccinia graminis f. sp. tritici]|uniref:Kinase subunit of RNA polymerase II carboxy-terminal domain kinase I n=2 Tax=Puccinia graminis f. sp. tritici TaxID=56615 RepID=E3JT12_PUCGT|nr:uncharacterized protein PGTG_01832 [Puccinia graminis f. sp. tritici CRL 75-36-700-3]EFP75239.1 hypothetical protein PGTG_01832 [Puccinia graminis f. sp. tritici CRL 75-36-700-3]KAA1121152.1 kinase subunit of RNA polymerase II carboxy-terminal domain kinase I [Puccinia graminis f. sp. tritici]